MPDNLAVVTRVITEHHAIRKHVKLAGDTVNDIEALFALQKTQSGWSQTSIMALIEKQDQLLKAISFLEQGLKNHFGFEEEALLPLLGGLLAKAILREHNQISRQINEAKTAVASMKLEGLEQHELLSKKSVIQQDINSLRQTVEEHAQHEEVVLNMMKKALEENAA
ncbi:MAG: hemerythrin domain-containing protein [Chloroflexota bacterium]